MNAIQGSRAGSKNHMEVEKPSCMDSNTYEARITHLFVPWLVDDIPDGKWSTLQGKLGCIVKDIKREPMEV